MTENNDFNKSENEKYKVTVNDLYGELKKMIEKENGDKLIKLSVNYDHCDHLQDLRAYSNECESWLLLMGYD